MMKSMLLLAAAAVLAPCSAFSVRSRTSVRSAAVSCRLHDGDAVDTHNEGEASLHALDRRSAISTFALLPLSTLAPSVARAEGKGKVVVMGGAGWVGAHVSKDLDARGYKVVSVSRSAPDVQVARTKSILGTAIPSVEYVSLDAGTASADDLASAMKDSVAVISCVGISPGSPNQKDGNGAVNVKIAKAAKSAGVPKFVYVGVASSLANGPAKFVLGDYFKGKAEAEASVAKEFGEASLIVKPAIVAGGTPGEVRPPGPPGVKPVDVEAVSKAVVAGVVGGLSGSIDGNDAIEALG